MEQSEGSKGEASADSAASAGGAHEKSRVWEDSSSASSDRSDADADMSARSNPWSAASPLSGAARAVRLAAGASSQKPAGGSDLDHTDAGCHLDAPGLPPPWPLALRATLVPKCGAPQPLLWCRSEAVGLLAAPALVACALAALLRTLLVLPLLHVP